MAALISIERYKEYNGSSYEPIYEDELEAILERSFEIIDSVTGGRLTGKRGVEWLPPFILQKVEFAICAQAAFIERNGGLSYLDSTTPVQMSLGKISYMYASGTLERKGFPISPLAISYLETTGLLCRSLVG